MGLIGHKLPGWELRLQALIDARLTARFAWGVNDCCMFAAYGWEACRGVLPAIPPYRTERGARRVLRALGGLEQALQALGAERLPAAALAQRGDIVQVKVDGPFGYALAVCAGAYAYAPGPAGLAAAPPELWLTGWRV